jgi:hypothetical protein
MMSTRKSRPEAALERQTLFTLGSDPDLAIFKNEVGEGFYGVVRGQIDALLSGAGLPEVRKQVLAILDRNRVHFGLRVGSADLIGCEAVRIEPAMVGLTFGRFVSIELKGPDGRMRPEQELWLARMTELGAAAGVARSPGDAALIVERGRR